MTTTVITWFLTAIIIGPNGDAHSQVLNTFTSLPECFEARDYALYMTGNDDANKRLNIGMQVVCIGKRQETI